MIIVLDIHPHQYLRQARIRRFPRSTYRPVSIFVDVSTRWERRFCLSCKQSIVGIPGEGPDDAIRVIKAVFRLSGEPPKPRWHLEGDIDLKEPGEYLFPSTTSPFSTAM